MKNKIDVIVFDVDGVLVDVRGSFHRSTVQTVHHFTGKRVPMSEIQKWKSRQLWDRCKAKYFCKQDWTGQFGLNYFNKFVFTRIYR